MSLQAVVDGQDTWAAVMEVVRGFETDGWTVDRYFPEYTPGVVPSAVDRLLEIQRIQRHLAARITQYDAIYIRAHELAWPISRLAALRGVPVVHECNGPYEDLFIAWPKTRFARPFFEYLQRSQYRAATAIIAVSQGLTEWLMTDTGNRHVVTIGNGANVDVFNPEVARREGLPQRFAVFFGQFPSWQGIDTVLDALNEPAWPDGLPVVFVGDGAVRPLVEAAVEQMPDRVIYLGRLPYDEVATVAAHADLSFVPMVMPERETMFSPLKLYESMACGVPVVASDTVGISEVVQACDCGVLVPAGDPAALAAATAELAGDLARAQEMGRKGRICAEQRYSWLARSRERRAVVEGAIERYRA